MNNGLLTKAYEQFWFKKGEKSVTDVRKGKTKERSFPS